MSEKYINIEKLDGGFIVEANGPNTADRKLLRKVSEVVAFVKEQLTEPVEPVVTND